MQDVVFVVAYIGFMSVLTWMTMAIINSLSKSSSSSPQTFYISAGDVSISEVQADDCNCMASEELVGDGEEEEDTPVDEESTADDDDDGKKKSEETVMN